MDVTFRRLTKETLSGQVPPEVAAQVRQLAARERLSLSAALTLLLCRGLEIDAQRFGLAAPSRKRSPRRSQAISA